MCGNPVGLGHMDSRLLPCHKGRDGRTCSGALWACHMDSRLLPCHKGRDRRTCSGALWACVTWAVDYFVVIRDRTAEHVLGPCVTRAVYCFLIIRTESQNIFLGYVGLCHMGSRLLRCHKGQDGRTCSGALCHMGSRLLPCHKGQDRRTCSGTLWACVTWTVDCVLVIKDRIAEHVLGPCRQSTACDRLRRYRWARSRQWPVCSRMIVICW